MVLLALSGTAINRSREKVFIAAENFIVRSAVRQPQVVVHRDYHSRNLMLLKGNANPGILDFQDAVIGPMVYDMASLLRDAYRKCRKLGSRNGFMRIGKKRAPPACRRQKTSPSFGGNTTLSALNAASKCSAFLPAWPCETANAPT